MDDRVKLSEIVSTHVTFVDFLRVDLICVISNQVTVIDIAKNFAIQENL